MLVKELVKTYREKRGWKQVDLASKLKVSQNYVSKIELGLALPRAGSFKERLGKVLDIPQQKLLEAYASSKLDSEESKALRHAMYRSFLLDKKKDKEELLSANERTLIEAFDKLSRKDRSEVLGILKEKSGVA